MTRFVLAVQIFLLNVDQVKIEQFEPRRLTTADIGSQSIAYLVGGCGAFLRNNVFLVLTIDTPCTLFMSPATIVDVGRLNFRVFNPNARRIVNALLSNSRHHRFQLVIDADGESVDGIAGVEDDGSVLETQAHLGYERREWWQQMILQVYDETVLQAPSFLWRRRLVRRVCGILS